jgi:NAD(P)H-nitrite reductase large subunit
MTKLHDGDVVICRCEEVTKQQIVDAILSGCHDLDSVKRCTRAGMGMCQSKTCDSIITRLIREYTGLPGDAVKPFTTRAPLRPVSMSALSQVENE